MKIRYNISLLIALNIFLICLYSCSAEKRLNRLIRNNPHLLEKDTTYVHDTTFIKDIQTDTVFHDSVYYERLRDTIVINNDRLTIRQYHYRDSIFIEGECKGDTITKEIAVPYEKVTAVTKEVTPSYFKWLVGGLIILCILVAFKSLKR